VSDSPTLIGRDRVQRHNLIGSAPGLQSHTVQAYAPSWIHYRHSLFLVDRREDAGETVETCRSRVCFVFEKLPPVAETVLFEEAA
jgi:hypothetical protein